MARATQRSGTANAQFRKRIPADVLHILDKLPGHQRPKGWGKVDITLTLGTSDKRLIAAEHARIARQVEDQIAALRAGPRRLTFKETVALAGTIYKAFAEALENNPGSPKLWQNVLSMNQEARTGEFGLASLMIGQDARVEASMETRFGPFVDAVLTREHLLIEPDSRTMLLREVANAADDAARKLERNAKGDFRPDEAAQRFPTWPDPSSSSLKAGSLTPMKLFEKWATHPEQKEQAQGTVKRYRSVIQGLSSFLQSPQAMDVSTSAVTRYLEARMANGLTPLTARDVHKAAISSVFGWALAKRLVAHNPAIGVVIKVLKPKTHRSPSITDAEARSLVEAVLSIPSDAARSLNAAKRWVPLLCLYSGARIGEVTQLRKEDFHSDRGQHWFNIMPEAGSVKTREFRKVPLHARLVDLGLLAFVEAAGNGPLFFDPASRRKANAATPQAQLVASDVGAWSRTVGLGDPLLLKPMHGLRHRFMTCARRAGVEEQYISAIVGHATASQNRRYGDYELKVLARELEKLDSLMLEGMITA